MCKCKTAKGTQCKNKPVVGSVYCKVHQKCKLSGKTSKMSGKAKPRPIKPKFYALFYVDVGGNSVDLHYELDHMWRGLYTTRENAEHAFAELHTAMDEDVDEIYPNGQDQDPVVNDDLLRKHGYKIMEVEVDK